MTSVTLSQTTPEYADIQARKRLGLILLSSDLTTEPDYARLMPPDEVACFGSRVKADNPTTPENLRRMLPRLGAAAALLPEDYPPAAICYSCTAASVVLGDDVVTQAIQLVWPGVPVVTPSHSAVLALQALQAQRISVLTPYLPETSEPMAEYFSRQGLDIQRFECLGIEDDRVMARVQPQSIIAAACAVDDPASEAIFISCTALPAIAVIAELEQKLGKPVVTSNQATAWTMLQHAGAQKLPQGYGRLFSEKLPG